VKIGLVIGAYHSRAGLERVAVETARAIRDRGHRIVVITQVAEASPADHGIEILTVGGIRRQIAGRAATFPIAATRAVGELNLDVVYAFGSSVLVPAVVRLPGAHRSWWELANQEWRANTVDGLRRRVNPHHRITLALDATVLGHGLPHEVLAAGEWAAEEIRRHYPRIADRVAILPDGVSLEEFAYTSEGRVGLRERWQLDTDGPVLLSVATELRRKGLDTLFDGFRLVRDEIPTARLVVGGRAPAADIRALAVAHGVQDGVRAIGEIEDMAAAYSAADVLIFPTRFDPWGLPIVEALACGTPVAASARAGASSAIHDGETGALIVDPTEPKQVAHAAISALYTRASRAQIRETVAHLSWPRIAEQLEPHLVLGAERIG
jgi:glycosyltransferase involved in cell wall biosynthesis